jgi:hypothetical protein
LCDPGTKAYAWDGGIRMCPDIFDHENADYRGEMNSTISVELSCSHGSLRPPASAVVHE